MDCQETRQKLSTYADKELGRDELQALARHLAECPTCSREYEKQGALDMLLKSHFSHEPPQEYFDSFWPSVAERLEGEEGGGAGSDDEVVVFKASPALKSLNIPQRRQVAPAVTDEPAPEPPAEGSPLRWPVALVVSTAIVVVGFLAYKKMFPQHSGEVTAVQPPAVQEPVEDRVGAMAPTEALDATQLALAPTGDGGLGMATTDAEPLSSTADDNGERRTRHRARSRRARRRKREAKSQPEPAAKSAPKAAAPRRPKRTPAKKTALDSLIDTAIGTSPTPRKKTTAAAPAAPASNLPEQLNMNQIRSAMNKIKPRVQACYDQHQVEGMAKVRFKISPDGKVMAPSIRGKFRGTDTGDCVIRAVKRASFPKFSGKPMTINSYPFLLQ